MARSGIPEAHINAIANTLFGLDKTEEGQSIVARLHYPGFERANSKTYDPVRKFLKEYERLFGKLPGLEAPKR